jgi:hypothetical protein
MVLLVLIAFDAIARTEPPSSVVWAPPPPVQFASNSARVTEAARRTLAAYASMARRKRHVRLSITGFTDERGAARVNRELSMRRALAVQRVLLDLGVSETQMDVHGGGEMPGDAGARRVDILVSVIGPVTFRALPFGGKAPIRLVIYLPDFAPRSVRLRLLARGAAVAERTIASNGRVDVADLAALLRYRDTADLEVSVSPVDGAWPVIAIGEGDARAIRLP